MCKKTIPSTTSFQTCNTSVNKDLQTQLMKTFVSFKMYITTFYKHKRCVLALQWGIKTCNWQVVSSSQLVCYHIIWVNSGLHTSGILHSFRWSAAVGGYVPILWVTDYKRWSVYNRIPYQVKQAACDRGITAENIEMSQNTDFNRDATNENTRVAGSNVWL